MKEINSNPLYEQVKTDIKSKIINHVFKPDTKIPAESELIDYYDISRITVRRAINDLVEEGLLIKKQGIGTFVKPVKQHRQIVNIGSFSEECKHKGINYGTKVLSKSIVKAKEKDKRMLNINIDDNLIFLERLRTIDNEPAIIDRTYLTMDYEWIMNLDDSSFKSLSSLLASHSQKKEVYADYKIEISYAREYEAALLACKTNSPVLLVDICTYDKDMKPLNRSEQVMYGDKFSIDIRTPFTTGKTK